MPPTAPPAAPAERDGAPQAPPEAPRVNQAVYEENGRMYGCFRRGKYMFPVDELEKDKLDIFHRFFTLILNHRLFRAALLDQETPRILDLGCGTGIWAIDVAELYPRAHVLGLDLNLIQPEFIPPNVRFQQVDIEVPWQNLDPGSWDLINMRTLAGSIANWPRLYAEVFRHLRPYHGHLEQVEINFTPRCDDHTMPPNFALKRWANDVMDAMDGFDRPLRVDSEATKRRLAEAGFVDIVEEILPFPINGWPEDPTRRELGRWFTLGFITGLEGLTMAPLFRGRDMSATDIRTFVQRVNVESRAIKIHAYMTVHIFKARKP